MKSHTTPPITDVNDPRFSLSALFEYLANKFDSADLNRRLDESARETIRGWYGDEWLDDDQPKVY
jgi:hypothetical protein